jgi:hypothetical protein
MMDSERAKTKARLYELSESTFSVQLLRLLISVYVKYHVMDFSNFDRCFDELRVLLRDGLGNGKNTRKLDIYGNYLDYGDEVKITVDRIEAETQKFMILSKTLHEALQKGEKPDEKWGIDSIKNLILIRLDIKSFLFFTRIFLDTLAWIIKQYYAEQGVQLPRRMRALVKSEKLKKSDSDFAEGLKDRMRWMDDFVTTRDEIVHHLGGICSTTTKNGKFGFDILGLRTRHDWGTNTVESIADYINETLHNLSEVISYIHSKFQSESIST